MSDPAQTEDVDVDLLEARLGSHVDDIMSAARKAATQLQAEVEAAATKRAAEIETASARRAHAVRMGAEADAERLQAHAITTTQQYLAASRRRVDEFAAERTRRMSEIADQLIVAAEALLARWSRADEVACQVDELRVALGAAMERIAVEAGRDGPELPELALPTGRADPPAAGPGEAEPEAEAQEPEVRRTLQDRLSRAAGRTQARDSGAAERRPGPPDEDPSDDA